MTHEASDSLVLSELLPCQTSNQNIGRLTLNSPRTLNSLNLEIMLSLREILLAWEQDPRVAAVVIDSTSEKALCAGGDVKRIHQLITSAKDKGQDAAAIAQIFFENEYRLDSYIHRYQKPIVIWGDGIVMGGGIGIMAGASHRVVTETTMMAMPEITIGLYPDVGASHFLAKMPGKIGLFLGLTATRMNAGDAIYVGLADHFVPRAAKGELLDAMRTTVWSPKTASRQLSDCLKSVGKGTPPPPSVLERRQADIDSLMNGSDVETIANRFEQLVIPPEDTFLAAARSTMLKGSPTSLKITLEQLRRGQGMSLSEAFRQELILSLQCCLHSDFAEGVRALLVDKDNAPKWSPRSLSEVSRELVLEHFNEPWAEGHPLADL